VVLETAVGDDPQATVAILRQALAKADLLVMSGGVSVGESDYVHAAFQAVGLRIVFNRVAVKPGKPVTLAAGSGKVVFGLPGNPVSAYLMFHLFVTRALAHLQGRRADLVTRRFPLAVRYERRQGQRLEFVPAVWTDGGTVRPIEFHGSAHLTALPSVDGFFIVPAGVTVLEAHTAVEFYFAPSRLP